MAQDYIFISLSDFYENSSNRQSWKCHRGIKFPYKICIQQRHIGMQMLWAQLNSLTRKVTHSTHQQDRACGLNSHPRKIASIVSDESLQSRNHTCSFGEFLESSVFSLCQALIPASFRCLKQIAYLRRRKHAQFLDTVGIPIDIY